MSVSLRLWAGAVPGRASPSLSVAIVLQNWLDARGAIDDVQRKRRRICCSWGAGQVVTRDTMSYFDPRRQVRDAHVDARGECATAYGWLRDLQWICSSSKNHRDHFSSSDNRGGIDNMCYMEPVTRSFPSWTPHPERSSAIFMLRPLSSPGPWAVIVLGLVGRYYY